MPSPKDLALSVFWIDDLLEPEIWKMGDDVAGQPRGKSSLARGDFGAAEVSEMKLTIEPDPEPHPRHAVLQGWPAEKDEQKAIAVELCARCTLHIRDTAA